MYNEISAIGTSIVSSILRNVVSTINIILCHEILWPKGQGLWDIQDTFHRLYGMLGLSGVIDVTHVPMA